VSLQIELLCTFVSIPPPFTHRSARHVGRVRASRPSPKDSLASDATCTDHGGVNSNDFITERGGDPEKIRESQRKRFAKVELVDEIIAEWDVHRRSTYMLMRNVLSNPTSTCKYA
jgi:hypothetical protein